MFKLNSNYFSLDDRENFFALSMQGVKVVKSNKRIGYYNVPAAFDIETSSFYSNVEGNKTSNYFDASKGITEKRAIPYIWQFGINGNVIIGRSFEDFQFFLLWLSRKLRLAKNLRLIVYVHNLSFEFQFFRKWCKWYSEENLTDKERQPIKMLCQYFIEFRCSYRLSGYSLKDVSENLIKYRVAKLDSLDYDKIRHEKTPMTPAEIEYCINDVLVVMAYIQEEIEREGSIDLLPFTNTGRVRRYVRRACLGVKDNEKYCSYMRLMKELALTPEIYALLKRAFQGGFVHANSYYVNQEIENVSSYDFTSSYPYVMLSEKFPMSKGIDVTSQIEKHNLKGLKYYLDRFCCLIDITLLGVSPKIMFDNFISVSKCIELENHVENNGRIVSADKLRIVITELDFRIIDRAYKSSEMIINKVIAFKKDYLPIDFIRAILNLYSDKTKLKGVEGKEPEYQLAKGMLNSCYGMTVTDIVRNEYVYDSDFHEWNREYANAEIEIAKYNSKKDRFLFYAWGVWITAYARYNLFEAIVKLGNDYIYSDTDSVKFVNLERNKHIFDEYNNEVELKLKQVAKDRELDYELFKPKTIKGVEKLIGVFDFEGTYLKFKTLGAKRYMTFDGENLNITVAGLPPKENSNYLQRKYGVDRAFKHFTFDLEIPAEYTGKNTHFYIDSNYSGIVVDYLGKPCRYESKSAIHLEKTTFKISIAEKYERFLLLHDNGGYIEIED